MHAGTLCYQLVNALAKRQGTAAKTTCTSRERAAATNIRLRLRLQPRPYRNCAANAIAVPLRLDTCASSTAVGTGAPPRAQAGWREWWPRCSVRDRQPAQDSFLKASRSATRCQAGAACDPAPALLLQRLLLLRRCGRRGRGERRRGRGSKEVRGLCGHQGPAKRRSRLVTLLTCG